MRIFNNPQLQIRMKTLGKERQFFHVVSRQQKSKLYLFLSALFFLFFMATEVADASCMPSEKKAIVEVEIFSCMVHKKMGETSTNHPYEVLIVNTSSRDVLTLVRGDRAIYGEYDYRINPLKSRQVMEYWIHVGWEEGCSNFLVGERKVMLASPICCDVNPPCLGPEFDLIDIHPNYAEGIIKAIDRMKAVVSEDTKNLE